MSLPEVVDLLDAFAASVHPVLGDGANAPVFAETIRLAAATSSDSVTDAALLRRVASVVSRNFVCDAVAEAVARAFLDTINGPHGDAVESTAVHGAMSSLSEVVDRRAHAATGRDLRSATPPSVEQGTSFARYNAAMLSRFGRFDDDCSQRVALTTQEERTFRGTTAPAGPGTVTARGELIFADASCLLRSLNTGNNQRHHSPNDGNPGRRSTAPPRPGRAEETAVQDPRAERARKVKNLVPRLRPPLLAAVSEQSSVAGLAGLKEAVATLSQAERTVRVAVFEDEPEVLALFADAITAQQLNAESPDSAAVADLLERALADATASNADTPLMCNPSHAGSIARSLARAGRVEAALKAVSRLPSGHRAAAAVVAASGDWRVVLEYLRHRETARQRGADVGGVLSDGDVVGLLLCFGGWMSPGATASTGVRRLVDASLSTAARVVEGARLETFVPAAPARAIADFWSRLVVAAAKVDELPAAALACLAQLFEMAAPSMSTQALEAASGTLPESVRRRAVATPIDRTINRALLAFAAERIAHACRVMPVRNSSGSTGGGGSSRRERAEVAVAQHDSNLWRGALAAVAASLAVNAPVSDLALSRCLTRARSADQWAPALRLFTEHRTIRNSMAALHPTDALGARTAALAANWAARSACANTAVRLARQPRPCAWAPALAALSDIIECSAVTGEPTQPSVAAIALLCVADSDLAYTPRVDVLLRSYARLRACAANEYGEEEAGDTMAPIHGALVYGTTTRKVCGVHPRRLDQGAWASAASLFDALCSGSVRRSASDKSAGHRNRNDSAAAAAAAAGSAVPNRQHAAEWVSKSLIVAAAEQNDHALSLIAASGDVGKCVGVLAASDKWAAAVAVIRNLHASPTHVAGSGGFNSFAVRRAALVSYRNGRFEEYHSLMKLDAQRRPFQLRDVAAGARDDTGGPVPPEFRPENKPRVPAYATEDVGQAKEAMDAARWLRLSAAGAASRHVLGETSAGSSAVPDAIPDAAARGGGEVKDAAVLAEAVESIEDYIAPSAPRTFRRRSLRAPLTTAAMAGRPRPI